MKKKKREKIVAILPAYNAQKTIAAFVESLPRDVFDEIIVVDDASSDDTFRVAKKLRSITLYRNPTNLGYGGNLKMCLGRALDHGADVIVELHPDGEYGTDGVLPAIQKINGGAHLVLGNRFAARPKGMYWQKIIVTRLLTMLDNAVFNTHIPDMHQGFRVYTKELLESVNYRRFSNNYLFSFEMIAAAIQNNCVINWVPVTATYRGVKRGAGWGASARYTLATLRVLMAYLFCFYKQNKYDFSLRYCQNCHIGFTYPVPGDMASYYPKEYWNPSGILGWAKAIVFRIAQKRRVHWVRAQVKQGNVLDVGSGSGQFGRALGPKFTVTSIDPYYQGEGVLQKNFLTWKTTKKFDAIVFWESLEHVSDPVSYLAKAKMLLKPGGLLFVEYPRYGCLESRIFGARWFHLDMPRHLVHFTDMGIEKMLSRVGYTIITQSGIWAFDYAPWGLVRNVLLFPIGVVLAWVLFLSGESPIGLIVAKKI